MNDGVRWAVRVRRDGRQPGSASGSQLLCGVSIFRARVGCRVRRGRLGWVGGERGGREIDLAAFSVVRPSWTLGARPGCDQQDKVWLADQGDDQVTVEAVRAVASNQEVRSVPSTDSTAERAVAYLAWV